MKYFEAAEQFRYIRRESWIKRNFIDVKSKRGLNGVSAEDLKADDWIEEARFSKVVKQFISQIKTKSNDPPKRKQSDYYKIIRDFETYIITQTLIECDKSVTEAAKELGMGRTSLTERMKSLGIKKEEING